MDHSTRPPHSFDPGFAEAIVLDAWLQREIVARRGANTAPALADRSEGLALERLAVALAASPQVAGFRTCLGWARAFLDPEETALPIDAKGCELPDHILRRGAPPPGAESARVEVTLPAADTLVLFEFLCREIDEQDGARLLAAFVSPAEFWALNNLHCVLETGEFYSALEDYGTQLEAARATLVASKAL